jgi:uncharacterized membrane protein
MMNGRMRLQALWNDLQSSLWFRPAAATLLAMILATVITTLDQMPYVSAPALLRIGADSARAVLAAIAGATLAVVGMIFSILMVALVLASQQFSPRILRNFIRDRISQDVLSIFIGTFVYSLLVLARISEHEDRIFTPVLSVTGAILFAIIATGAFIFFIDHITKTIRANYMIADINRQTETLLNRLYAQEVVLQPPAVDEEKPSWEAAEATAIGARRPGYIQSIDYATLVRVAQDYEIVVEVERMVGDFVAREGEILSFLPAQKMSQTLLDDLHNTFDIGTERTLFGDVLFGIRQLVDIALKAISPAINDPTTATNCIDYLSNLLIQVARQSDFQREYRDREGRLRVIAPRPTFAMMLDSAFNQIRHYSPSEVTITLRLLDALNEIAQATNLPERHTALWRHASMISRTVDRNIHEPLERQQVNDRLYQLAAQTGQEVEKVLLA